jgi:hypothetical protein
MNEKESVSVYRIIGQREFDTEEIKAIEEGTLRIDLDPNNEKDIQVSKAKEGYKITLGGGTMEIEITTLSAHALMRKMEEVNPQA